MVLPPWVTKALRAALISDTGFSDDALERPKWNGRVLPQLPKPDELPIWAKHRYDLQSEYPFGAEHRSRVLGLRVLGFDWPEHRLAPNVSILSRMNTGLRL